MNHYIKIRFDLAERAFSKRIFVLGREVLSMMPFCSGSVFIDYGPAKNYFINTLIIICKKNVFN